MKNWKKFFGMLGALICALGLNAMEFKSNPNVIAELVLRQGRYDYRAAGE